MDEDEQQMADFNTQVRRVEASIHLGITAEDGWNGPAIKPGQLADDQIAWLASWLVGEGVTKDTP